MERYPSAVAISDLFATTITGTVTAPFISSRSRSCISIEYPQCSEGSRMKRMTEATFTIAESACRSIWLRSSAGRSRIPGVSTNWILLRPSWRRPTMTPFVVNGYEAISGVADEISRMNEDFPTFGYPAMTMVKASSMWGSFRSTFLTSFRNRRSSSIWWTMEAIRATACRRMTRGSSDFLALNARSPPTMPVCFAAQPTAPSDCRIRSSPKRMSAISR